MFIVKNNGQFPIIIRDLNLHVSGGKEVDLDSLFSRDTIDRSVNLARLVQSNKLLIVNKEKKEVKKQVPIAKSKNVESAVDSSLLLQIKKELLEVKDLIRSGASSRPSVRVEESLSQDTIDKLNKLRVMNLSKDDCEVETNFDQIGNTTEKEEGLGALLDALDALEEGK